jgi:hypothetical protein
MAGYIGCKMSKNAANAYLAGKKPISKWTKKDILAEVQEYLEGDPLKSQKLALFQKCRLGVLKNKLLRSSEWHHTSAYYLKTDFYAVDEDIVTEITVLDLLNWLREEPDGECKGSSGCHKGTIEYLTWYGTRMHPKARENRLENVLIEERGSFYYVYDPTRSNKLILKKKIGSSGTYVTYKYE